MNLYIYLYYISELNQKYDDECIVIKKILSRESHISLMIDAYIIKQHTQHGNVD